MLHVVQVVMWGVAETPLLFLDEEKARSAYVENTRKQWEQRYAAYCEYHGTSAGSFSSAHAFISSIDASEKSTINFWTINPEEPGIGVSVSDQCGPGAEDYRQAVEGLHAVKEGLARLLFDVSNLADRFALTEGASMKTRPTTGPKKSAPAPPTAPREEPESAPETYTTPEWKAFAGTIKRLCSGSRNEFYLLPKDDWRQDVYSNRTALEYWDWVADRIVKYKELAKSAGYSVIEDPAAPGCQRFINREGLASEECQDSEWEAWCAAGLHLEVR